MRTIITAIALALTVAVAGASARTPPIPRHIPTYEERHFSVALRGIQTRNWERTIPPGDCGSASGSEEIHFDIDPPSSMLAYLLGNGKPILMRRMDIFGGEGAWHAEASVERTASTPIPCQIEGGFDPTPPSDCGRRPLDLSFELRYRKKNHIHLAEWVPGGSIDIESQIGRAYKSCEWHGTKEDLMLDDISPRLRERTLLRMKKGVTVTGHDQKRERTGDSDGQVLTTIRYELTIKPK